MSEIDWSRYPLIAESKIGRQWLERNLRAIEVLVDQQAALHARTLERCS